MSAGITKYVAIGDVHGCAKTLEALLSSLGEYSGRTFVFVGDYIDRGPDSKGVVDLLLDFSSHEDCIMLRGNHEQMMLDALETGSTMHWLYNGGRTTLKSYGQSVSNIDLPHQHYHFYKNTRLFYNTHDYFFVHAGLQPTSTIEEALQDEENHHTFLWTRSHLAAEYTAFEKKVIFGHTPEPNPIIADNMIGIDTGCVYNKLPGFGKLTAVTLPEEEFITQDCIDDPEPY